ncbi:MAG: permease [Hyphomicrobiaceae bacterium]
MTHTASLSWFARHELNLAWRDWVALMSGGRKLKDSAIAIGMLIFALALHGMAYAVVAPFLSPGAPVTTTRLVMVFSAILLTFTMMLSQAMESVTRAFYARDDLDLILSSPASSRDLFAVRISIMALTTAMMSGLIVTPFINAAVLLDGAHWLAAYGMVFAVSLLATGCAVLIALGLFKSIGAKRTRLVAQIAAAIVGAVFLIGIQVVAIVSYGTMSRWSVMNSQFVIENAPGAESIVWLPAFAASGNLTSLLLILAVSAAFFAYAASRGASQFRFVVLAALGVADDAVRQASRRPAFQRRSTHYAVMRKELQLLGRDPWLISQTLMQVLYLIPPALMLWVSYGDQTELSTLIAPVIVMAVGQLAGGLAWLAISGEDAPDLVATAPVRQHMLTLAKIATVLAIVVGVAAPLVLAMALLSVWSAFVTFIGTIVAALCAIFIQLCFRAQAKRANFRRRQIASRTSTVCEALASILCAGTIALWAAGSLLALIPGCLTAGVLAVAWFARPRKG